MIPFLFILCFLITILLTPVIKSFALKIGAIDHPAERKVHKKQTPLLGGLAIYISFMIGVIILMPDRSYTIPIICGAAIVTLTGLIDDIFTLSVKWKLFGQSIAAVVVIIGGVDIEFIALPFDRTLEFGLFGIPLTFLWIIAITNAINLIDGLDGLAAGVSSIVLTTISIIAAMEGNIVIFALAVLLLASTSSFLFYNFHPAKIFMGDTGSLFLGFMIAVISILGFKSITFFTLIVPIIILGVPISDSVFAIIRRLVNKKPLAAPDNAHLHHCILNLGFSHRATVVLIYGLSAFFAICAVLLAKSTLLGGIIITVIFILTLELVVEMVGLVHRRYRPMLNFIQRLISLKNSQYSIF